MVLVAVIVACCLVLVHNMARSILYIESAGICAPGIQDWDEFLKCVQDTMNNGVSIDLNKPTVIPAATILPPNERRRTTKTIKLALHCMQQILPSGETTNIPMASVFASCSGDMDLVQSICMALSTDEKAVSPIQFHNSVHNAAAGYWSIGSEWMQETTSISAANGTFVAAMLESASQIHENNQKIALCCYDISSQPPLDLKRPVKYDFGCAFVLTLKPTERSMARLSLQLSTVNIISKMGQQDLETLRADNPSAAALPLLFTLASGHEADLTIPYLPGLDMSINVKSL